MAEPDPGRVKELIEAFEIVLSYVGRVYSVEYVKPIGDVAKGLVGYVKEEPIELGENRPPDKDVLKTNICRCSACNRIIIEAGRSCKDETGGLHVVCKRCSSELEQRFGRSWRADKNLFE